MNGLERGSDPAGLRPPRWRNGIDIFGGMYDYTHELLSCCVTVKRSFTQRNLLSGVSGKQEDQQGQTRDEHAGDEQVQAVIKSPATHGDCECHIWVGLLTAVVVQLVTLCRHPW